MILNWTDILKWFKLSSKHFIALSLASGAILFLPADVLVRLGIFEFSFLERQWIGLVFIVSCAFSFVFSASWLTKIIKSAYGHIKFRYISFRALKNLSSEEKSFLSYYIVHGTKSCCFKASNGLVASLQASNLIYQASNILDYKYEFSYNLYPHIWKELKKHPEFLEPELTQNKK
jgi:hypothetical protein